MIQRNEPVGYPCTNPAIPRLTGVSTLSRKAPSKKPTISAARQPLAFRRLNDTPRKKTAKIGGGRHSSTPCRESDSPFEGLKKRGHNSVSKTHTPGATRPPHPR